MLVGLCGGLVGRLIIFYLSITQNLRHREIMKGVGKDLSLRSYKCLPQKRDKSSLKDNLDLLFHYITTCD